MTPLGKPCERHKALPSFSGGLLLKVLDTIFSTFIVSHFPCCLSPTISFLYTHFRSRLNWAFAALSPLRVRFQSKLCKSVLNSKSGAPKMTSERKGQNDVRGTNEKKIIVYGEMLNNE